MITLRPPFRAENMEGLYNKVIRGQYSKIPEKFSNDLVELVKFLLHVHPENRPSPDMILKHPIIQKRLEFFKTHTEDMNGQDHMLLQTIRIPKNLLFLTDRLPQANYNNNKGKKKVLNTSSKNQQTANNNEEEPTRREKDNIIQITKKPAHDKEKKEEKRNLQQILIDYENNKKLKEQQKTEQLKEAKKIVEKEKEINIKEKEKDNEEEGREKSKVYSNSNNSNNQTISKSPSPNKINDKSSQSPVHEHVMEKQKSKKEDKYKKYQNINKIQNSQRNIPNNSGSQEILNMNKNPHQ